MPEGDSSAASENRLDAGAVLEWGQYAKERYDAAEKRLSDFRSWARQLAAAVGVVVGLEAALLGNLARADGLSPYASASSLLLVLGAVAWQLVILGGAVRCGYVGQHSLGPESPVVLANHVTDEAATRTMIAAYYANGSERTHAIAERVAGDTGRLAKSFTRSLWLLFAGILLTASLISVSSSTGKAMSDKPVSTGPAGPAPTTVPPSPAAAQPASPAPTSPLLVTPTPGQTETRAAPAPRETLVATPTLGQRVSEGIDSKHR